MVEQRSQKPQDSNVIIWPYIHYTHTQTIGVMWFRNRVHKANRRSFRSVRSRRAVGPCLSCCLPTQRNRPRSASPPVGRCTRVGCRRRRSRSRRRRRGARGRGPASNSPASSDSLPATGAGRATRRPPRRDSPRSGGPLRRGRGDRRTARRCQWCARRRARPTRSPRRARRRPRRRSCRGGLPVEPDDGCSCCGSACISPANAAWKAIESRTVGCPGIGRNSIRALALDRLAPSKTGRTHRQ